MNRRRILIVLLTFCAVLMAPLCALAVPGATQVAPLGIHSEVINPAGEFVVYVLKEGEWKEAGKLSFDKYFRQKEMDLSKYITGDGNVKIRLVEKGGGAAHIDAVLLGDRPPVEVKGIDDVLALKKLSKKDFDVVDAFEKSIELAFPSSDISKVMSLTARVEGTRNSQLPFQFPLSNFSKKMTGNSEFYHYSLMAGGSGPQKNGRPDMAKNPFFKEYSFTGSGHPSGYTYGWVRNDDKKLYVTIDFTPDDTMDGDKDYSKVYVKTKEGVKEFKMSVPETKWGNPDFTYTDKVAYQHKVYDFAIPLREIGIKDVKKQKELLLAFEAYGTAGALFPICRTSGFWGTHAGTEKKGSINITQDVISAAYGQCLAVCGQKIDNTSPDSANSAVEALCVSTQGNTKVQLADQLTAATLNCAMSDAMRLVGCSGGDCTTCSIGFFVPGYAPGIIDIGSLVNECNDACINGDATATVTPVGGNPVTVNCIDALGCFNNGGVFDAGTGPATARCQTGTCSIDHSPCGIQGFPLCGRRQSCVPLANSCAIRPLCQVIAPGNFFELCFDATKAGVTCPPNVVPPRICTPSSGSAGSSNECNLAIGNQCTIVEGGCSTGVSDECRCPAGQTLCGGTCVDTSTDNNNCGSCGTICSGGQSCVSGTCSCPAGETLCSGTCVNTQTDKNNCGGCANACTGAQSCVSGVCTCPAGETLCSGTCVNTSTDSNNCSGCGTVCSGTTGTCCDSTCVDLQTDKTHCGSCGNSCPGNIHFECCSGSCTDTQFNNSNCGSCGNSCAAPTGTCCDSACVDTSSNSENCGTCGTICSGSCCSSTCCPGACSGSGCS